REAADAEVVRGGAEGARHQEDDRVDLLAVVLLVAREGGVPALGVEPAERREDGTLGVGDRVAPAVVGAGVSGLAAVLALDLDAQRGAGLLGEADRDARTSERDLGRAVGSRIDR